MIKLVMFKNGFGGARLYNFQYEAMSYEHAKMVAQSAYDRMGLVGRFYVETSDGQCFSIN